MTDEDTRPPPTVRLGHEGLDHITIRILGRMHPDAEDYWDGNWLVTPLSISVGGFTAEIGAGLRSEELRSFREGLQRLQASLAGQAKLVSMEGWLDLRVDVAASGRLVVAGQSRDRLGSSANELSFSITELDQSYLPVIIEDLQEAERRFPVLASP